jgi:hypothetical protein
MPWARVHVWNVIRSPHQSLKEFDKTKGMPRQPTKGECHGQTQSQKSPSSKLQSQKSSSLMTAGDHIIQFGKHVSVRESNDNNLDVPFVLIIIFAIVGPLSVIRWIKDRIWK